MLIVWTRIYRIQGFTGLSVLLCPLVFHDFRPPLTSEVKDSQCLHHLPFGILSEALPYPFSFSIGFRYFNTGTLIDGTIQFSDRATLRFLTPLFCRSDLLIATPNTLPYWRKPWKPSHNFKRFCQFLDKNSDFFLFLWQFCTILHVFAKKKESLRSTTMCVWLKT